MKRRQPQVAVMVPDKKLYHSCLPEKFFRTNKMVEFFILDQCHYMELMVPCDY